MEVSGAPADVLLQSPWLPVNISGCQLLTKTWFGDSSYHILLTDMVCVWEEWMDSAAIQRRSQELNKRLRAPVKAFFSHLCEVVQPCLSGSGTGTDQADDEAQISLTTRREGGNMVMRLKSELAGLPFYWEFHCTPAPVTMACVQLVRPLLTMSRLLQRQVAQLGCLLMRKDAEIQDYRENGATLTRERLQTDVFEEQTYREDFMAKIFARRAPKDQYPPHHSLLHHFHKSAFVLAPFVAFVSHTEGNEGQRDSGGETATMTGAGAFIFYCSFATQTPHPAQVNICAGGISPCFPLIHTHTHTLFIS
ncbi:non-homologous end-joining factor 1 isoform X2 [Solea solea]|uniref:non-homologous end-joining factor 1 isoform X2 n=1 Tax=Solea solea TaxID=90069 RepID=UPI00272D7967|nr:non-homologous end-joining factor 1 isoform X2 [Solea solea]